MTDHEAAMELLNEMIHQAATAEVNGPHVIIAVDPESGSRTASGPYPDGATALAAATRWADELNAGMPPDEAPYTTHVAPLYGPDH